jgi:intein/homing endonuclease
MHPQYIGKINVKTRYGFYPILNCAITARNSRVIEIKTEYGKTLKTSPDHLLCDENQNWIKVKDLIP